MNYEEKSDFEINSEVHNIVNNLGFSLQFLGCDRIKWLTKGEQPVFTGKTEYSKHVLINYCNSPSDAWPIIASMIACGCIVQMMQAGVIVTLQGGGRIQFMDKNPLRAAMIVFLMIKSGEQG